MLDISYIMTKCFLIAILASALTCGCGNSDKKESSGGDSTDQSPGLDTAKGKVVIGGDSVPEGTMQVFRETPADVVGLIFTAARINRKELLKGLCPPSNSHDAATDCICAFVADFETRKCGQDGSTAMAWDDFRNKYKNGRIVKPPVTTGDRTEITYTLMIDGGDDATMILQKEGGSWYLLKI